MSRLSVGLLVVACSVLAVYVSADDEALQRSVYGLAGSGVPVNALGEVDPSGAAQLNIPIAYTLHDDQAAGVVVLGKEAGGGSQVGGGVSVGLFGPGKGLELGGLWLDDALSGAVRKQVFSETVEWPAIAFGMFDLGDNIDRRGYVVATKQVGTGGGVSVARVPRVLTGWWPPAGNGDQARAGAPRTWGQLILREEANSRSEGSAIPLLMVPAGTVGIQVDGNLAAGEWDDAECQTLRPSDGHQLTLYAKHDGMNLYFCLASPTHSGIVPGARAEIYIEVPQEGAEKVGVRHQRYRVQALSGDRVRLTYLQGRNGAWRVRQGGIGSSAVAAFAAAVSGRQTPPVFEFAIPLGNLYDRPGLPPTLGLATYLHLPGGVARASQEQPPAPLAPSTPVKHKPGASLLRWPGGPVGMEGVHVGVLPTRPDLWGKVGSGKYYGRDAQEVLEVPLADEGPTIDGEMELGEWLGAPATFAVPDGGDFEVYAQMTPEALYVAAALGGGSGNPATVTCEVYVDPDNDEGLVVRPDDRLYVLSRGQAECRSRGAGGWERSERSDFRAVAGHATEGDVMVCEFEIPFAELGEVQPGQQMGLAVQMAFGRVPPRAPVTRVAGKPAAKRVTPIEGSGTYVTAGWQESIFGGVSAKAGDSGRLIAEYDGDGVNLGYLRLGWPRGRWNLLMGVNDVGGADGNRWTAGLGVDISR